MPKKLLLSTKPPGKQWCRTDREEGGTRAVQAVAEAAAALLPGSGDARTQMLRQYDTLRRSLGASGVAARAARCVAEAAEAARAARDHRG
jgi:hypothetical protein